MRACQRCEIASARCRRSWTRQKCWSLPPYLSRAAGITTRQNHGIASARCKRKQTPWNCNLLFIVLASCCRYADTSVLRGRLSALQKEAVAKEVLVFTTGICLMLQVCGCVSIARSTQRFAEECGRRGSGGGRPARQRRAGVPPRAARAALAARLSRRRLRVRCVCSSAPATAASAAGTLVYSSCAET